MRAVGIDLGAKALHVVVVEARPDLTVVDAAVVLADSLDEIRQLCGDADVIAIDAPSEPSTALHARDEALSGKFRVARCGEIALGEQHRCWVPWVTPQSAEAAPPWMRAGFAAWRTAREAGHTPVEVYPSGVFRSLAGRRLEKKTTALGARQRVEVLRRHLELPLHVAMWSHDALDATAAALVAAWKATNGPVTAARHDHDSEDGSAIWMPTT